MKSIKLKGFVIKTYPFGESHKFVTLFSEELGKIKVIAHGLRKTSSKYGSSFELLNEVSLVLSPSKSDGVYNIKDFSLTTSLHTLRENLNIINLLYHLADFINYFTNENHIDKNMYTLLKSTILQILIKQLSIYELVRSFELKSLKILGFLPDINLCCQCNNLLEYKEIYISDQDGWLFCNECSKGFNDNKINHGTYRFLLNLLAFDNDQVVKLKINGIFKKETDLAFDKLISSILGKNLISSKYLTS